VKAIVRQLGSLHILFKDRDGKIQVQPIASVYLCENGCSGEAVCGFPVSRATFNAVIEFLSNAESEGLT
jgi:hypothetical protein